MEITKDKLRLISKLEEIINNNIIDTAPGSQFDTGKGYAYYVKGRKSKDRIKDFSRSEYLTEYDIKQLHYRISRHKIYIGNSIICILKELENRYGIDFEQLEKNYIKNIYRSIIITTIIKTLIDECTKNNKPLCINTFIQIAESVYVDYKCEGEEIKLDLSPEEMENLKKEEEMYCNDLYKKYMPL